MRVDWLGLDRFRSYRELEWRPDPGVNLLIGPNGAGKTNLLEATAYLATLKSFRRADDGALIADGADGAVVRAALVSDERDRLIEIELSSQGRRRTQVDKTKLKRTADLLGVVRAVAFLPEDLDLVKRGPSVRRDLLDNVAVQLWPVAHLDQSQYERALRQRNAFLKANERDDATLSVWDSRLSESGGRVLARRARVIEMIGPLLDAAYAEVAGVASQASIQYRPGWASSFDFLDAADYAELFLEALESVRPNDYDRRMTTVGPHRDEPWFSLEGHDARIHGSQGEQRTMALGVKLASHRAVTEMVNEPPVLLLDDVFSELDPMRSVALAAALPESTQTIITSARREDVPISGRTWTVSGGAVS